MLRIPVTEARDQLSELVARVQYGGERITLTKHGRPAAMLVPVEQSRTGRPKRPAARRRR
jgi:prevent-host-death family protein